MQNISGVCLPGMQRGERSLAANVTVALWLSVQWTCCSGEKAGGWYPTYLITDDVHHTSPKPTSRRDGQARAEGCWVSVNKAWLTWRQTVCEAQLKIRATCRRAEGDRGKATQHDTVGSRTTPDEPRCAFASWHISDWTLSLIVVLGFKSPLINADWGFDETLT